MTQTLTVALPFLQVKVRPGARLKHAERGDCALCHRLSTLSCQFTSPFLFGKLQGDLSCPESVLLTRELYELTCSIFILTCTWGMTNLNLSPPNPPNPSPCSCSVSALNVSVTTDPMWRVMWNLKLICFCISFFFFKTKWFCLSKWS